jgi:DNA-binding MarR family transcriptional regulator
LPEVSEDGLADVREAFAGRIGFLLQRAHNRLREAVVATLDGSGVNPGQLAILGALTARNDLTQRALTLTTGIEKSSMVIFIDRLEADGWVERRAHGDDRRARVVHLTAKGRKRLVSLGPRLDAVEERFLAGLSRAERVQLLAVLQRLR